MSKLAVIKTAITRGVGRGVLLGKKYSPEILLGAGLILGGAATVSACKATYRADQVIDQFNANMGRINHAKELIETGKAESDYLETGYRQEVTATYMQAGVGFVKLYWPSITLSAASVVCILSSFGIMKRRNLALVAAFKAVDQSFKDYRKRVVEKFGAEEDFKLKNGIIDKTITTEILDENGNVIEKKDTVQLLDENGRSLYAVEFKEGNDNWSPSPIMNMNFLQCQERFANDLLDTRGHVLLHEVYDALGVERTPISCVVGWVKKGNGDGHISFKIFETDDKGYRNSVTNDTIGDEREEFIAGRRNEILLDFNVDGLVYELI